MFKKATYDGKKPGADESWHGQPVLVCTEKVLCLSMKVSAALMPIKAVAVEIDASRIRPGGIATEYMVALNPEYPGCFYTHEALRLAIIRETLTRYRDCRIALDLGTEEKVRQTVLGKFFALNDGVELEDVVFVTPKGEERPFHPPLHPHAERPSFSPRKILEIRAA